MCAAAESLSPTGSPASSRRSPHADKRLAGQACKHSLRGLQFRDRDVLVGGVGLGRVPRPPYGAGPAAGERGHHRRVSVGLAAILPALLKRPAKLGAEGLPQTL